jgi:SHS2 domain-containing protein
VRPRPDPLPREADWEHFAHDADVGVRGRGRSLEEAFARAALALTAVVTDPGGVREETSVEIACGSRDLEGLLFEWLNALVFEMDTRDLVFGRYDVTIEDTRLQARAYGEAVDVARHRPAVEVKGATMTGLRVARTTDGDWIAECVVDV